ncbi:MAG: hypothetical protein IJ257_05580 [Treponema sp.]|nr:hypothetical protein [Treponema sp.]
MNIVETHGATLSLSSGLSQNSFAKTHLIDLLSKKSRLVHIENKSATAEDYIFSGTKAGEDGITLFEGPALDGKTLSDILKIQAEERTEEDLFAIYAFLKASDYLLQQEEALDAVGAGGIVIKSDEKAEKADILFINPEIFEICAQNHKESYAELQGKYLYKGLDERASLLFTRAVAAYRAITGNFPFENEDTTKRQEDIFDSNFIPLSLWKPEINEELAESIQASLSISVKNEVMAGKRSISDSKAEQKRENTLKKAQNFKSEDFFKEISEFTKSAQANQISGEEKKILAEKRAAFLSRTNKKLAVKRFFRRNKNRILTSIVIVLAVSWFVSGILRQNAKLVTTKGLTSTETSQALYTMIHRMDVPNLQEIVKGKETKDIIVKVSGYFVSAKQRLEVSPNNGILTPAKWFFYKKESKSWLFGITNLKIDGEDYKIEGNYPTRKEKPLPIKEEKGKILVKGDEISHEVSYNLVHQAEAKFYVERMTDKVTLRWTGKQWRVVKIEGKSKIDSVKAKDFIEEYYALAEKGVREATKILREKYDWLPGEGDFKDAAEFLAHEYGSVEAEKYLEKNP